MTLITQTLLSSWLYTYNCAEGYEEDAYNDFLRTLRREPGEQNEAMQKGILFENGVYALMRDPKDMTVYPSWRSVSEKIADMLRGGQTQVRVQRQLSVGKDEYLLYGICDVVMAGHIYDLKFTTKGMTSTELAGKYLGSPQHPAYLYCLPEARDFTYLVSDGQELYTEVYERKSTPDIAEIIDGFRTDLRYRGLDEIYKELWQSK